MNQKRERHVRFVVLPRLTRMEPDAIVFENFSITR